VRVWRSLDEVEGVDRAVVTIGNFDGVHRGHRHVVNRIVERARERLADAVVVTFDPHPMTVVRPEAAPLALSTLDHRLSLLAEAGVDGVLVLPFTRELSQLSPEEFVRRVLVDGLRAAEVHVGENFRFGHRAAGDVDALKELGSAYGFDVGPIALVGNSNVWSSTYIRGRLTEGDVEAAAAALGRPHRVEGPVVVGDRRGRDLGYPTANVEVDERTAVPKDGVYAGWLVQSSGECLPAAISIGTNPTFGGIRRRVEAYVLDREDLELYGEHVALDFAQRLRDTLKFDGVEPLLEQMADDVRRSREITG
jgi:riboflavin kinase / FMN adenylyltransferase